MASRNHVRRGSEAKLRRQEAAAQRQERCDKVPLHKRLEQLSNRGHGTCREARRLLAKMIRLQKLAGQPGFDDMGNRLVN